MSDAYCDATKEEEIPIIRCDKCDSNFYFREDHWIHYVNNRIYYFCDKCVDKPK